MSNLDILFQSNAQISSFNPLDSEAIWPHSIEVCITKVPIRAKDGYDAENMKIFADKLKKCMVNNGIVFFICYAPIEAKYRPFEIAKIMVDAGFTHIDNIIVEKSWLPGKRSEINLVNSHEYVLHFCNGKVWQLDRLPIRKYLNTDDNASCPGNVWRIKTGSLDEAYPLDLAELLLRMTDVLPGSIIFDPFCGTTSSLSAALKLGHRFYGFEQNDRKLIKMRKIADDFFSKR